MSESPSKRTRTEEPAEDEEVDIDWGIFEYASRSELAAAVCGHATDVLDRNDFADDNMPLDEIINVPVLRAYVAKLKAAKEAEYKRQRDEKRAAKAAKKEEIRKNVEDVLNGFCGSAVSGIIETHSVESDYCYDGTEMTVKFDVGFVSDKTERPHNITVFVDVGIRTDLDGSVDYTYDQIECHDDLYPHGCVDSPEEREAVIVELCVAFGIARNMAKHIARNYVSIPVAVVAPETVAAIVA